MGSFGEPGTSYSCGKHEALSHVTPEAVASCRELSNKYRTRDAGFFSRLFLGGRGGLSAVREELYGRCGPWVFCGVCMRLDELSAEFPPLSAP